MATSRDIISEASRLLNDPRNEQWAVRELLDWVNEGLQALVTLLPNQFITYTTLTLVSGTKQVLPAGSVGIKTCIRSLDPTTSVPIGAIGLIDFDVLDSYSPEWHLAPPATPEEWAPDPSGNPLVFWVNPPAFAGAKVDVELISNPAVLQIDTTIPIEARYHSKLVDYVVYRALSKDADYAGQDGRATLHRNRFYEGANNGAAQRSG